MHLGDRAIAALRTPLATLIVLATALVAQLPHAADVFRLVVHGDGVWATAHSYSYAIALELAVLLFVVQRRNVESYVFAVVSVCVNLAYYALHGVNLLSVAAAPAWLISIALPAAIARYSHLIVDAAQDATQDAPPIVASEPVATPKRRRLEVQQNAQAEPNPATIEDAPPTIDARAQALQMHAEGMSPAQIARALNANYSTVRSWLKRAQHTNGVAQ